MSLPRLSLLFTAFAASATSAGVFSSVSSLLYDPAWNSDHRIFIWAVILSALLLSGLGLPLPEDVPLTVTGFTTTIAAGGKFELWRFAIAFVLVCVPILLGDILAYSMGSRWGFGLRDRFGFLRRALTNARLERVRHWFSEYGSFTVFLGRQLAGVRFVTFFTAGTMRMRLPTFVFFDFLGCLVSVPAWLTLGFLAARYGREWLAMASSRVGLAFMIGALILATVLYLVARQRSARRARQTVAPSTSNGV